MTEYSDRELLQLSKDEAVENLTEEQLERYNELKKKELEGEIDEYKTEQGLKDAEGMETLIEGVKDEFSDIVEIGGHEIKVLIDPDQQDFGDIAKLQKYQRNDSSLTEESYEEHMDLVLQVLGNVSVDYSKEDWQVFAEKGDFNLMTMIRFLEKIIQESDVDLEQKKRR